jgi:hypothetical protein
LRKVADHARARACAGMIVSAVKKEKSRIGGFASINRVVGSEG